MTHFLFESKEKDVETNALKQYLGRRKLESERVPGLNEKCDELQRDATLHKSPPGEAQKRSSGRRKRQKLLSSSGPTQNGER